MLDRGQTGEFQIAVLSSAGGGGGGIAAHRVASALEKMDGVSAKFLTGEGLGGFLPSEVAPQKNMSNRKLTDTHYTVEYPGYRRDWLIEYLSRFDIVNVHWASYLLSLGELDALSRRGTRMLFTLHDFHYITGGCHYPAGCTGMNTGCFNCQQVDSDLCDSKFIPINLRIKQGIFARSNVHLSAPSQYLRDMAVATGIIPAERAHVLRNPYLPLDPEITRVRDGTTRILLVADSLTERRKAMPLALDSLAELQRRIGAGDGAGPIMVDIVGQADDALLERLKNSQVPYQLHGRITDHARLVDIFALNDIVLSCSYEDNWPNILVEAGAYGCIPVVGPGHGCEEFVKTYDSGAVAPAYTAGDFADTLARVAGDVTIRGVPDSGVQERICAEHHQDLISARFLEIAAQIRSGSEYARITN